MARKKTPSLIEDLARFQTYFDGVLNGDSLRIIAKKAGVSTSVLVDARARLERRYNTVLIESVEKSGKRHKVTNAAVQLINELRRVNGWRPEKKPILLRVAVSHSLLTWQLVTPTISAFLAKQREQKKDDLAIELSAFSGLEWDNVIRSIHENKIDMAFVWGLGNRLPASPPRDLDFEQIDGEFDVTLVSNRKVLVDSTVTETNLDWLSTVKIAVLRGDNQPLISRIPLPAHSEGGDRVFVDNFDAGLALVRSGVCDCALVPGVYVELDNYLRQRTLFYRPLNNSESASTKIPICIYARKGLLQSPPSPVANFVDAVRERVHGLSELFRSMEIQRSTQNRYAAPPKHQRNAENQFPPTAEWYEKIKYGYYLNSPNRGVLPVEWRWETVELNQQHSSEGRSRLCFSGSIRNSLGHTFTLERAECVSFAENGPVDLFYFVARNTKFNKDPTSCGFVSVFNWCSRSYEAMFGTWLGTDVHGEPLSYGTVWSHNKLNVNDLIKLTHDASLNMVLHAETGLDFENQ